jgi:hypothetical protein
MVIVALPPKVRAPPDAPWIEPPFGRFTGHLVAVEAKRQGLRPVLAGRRAGPITNSR